MRLNPFASFRRYLPAESLRMQLLSRSLFILAGLLLLVGILQYVLMQQYLYRDKAESIKSQIRSIPPQTWLQPNNNPRRGGPINSIFALHDNPTSTISFIDANGSFTNFFEEMNETTVPVLPAVIYKNAMIPNQRGISYQIMDDEHGAKQMVVLQPVGDHDHEKVMGIVQVSTSLRPLQDMLSRELMTFAILTLLALLAGLFTFLPILRRTLVPLSNMVDTVEQINSGNLSERLSTHQGQLEIDRLSMSFNAMLERLETSFIAEKEAKDQMGRFIADASHELRTPLTSIHGFLEVLLRGAAAQPDQLNKALISMYGESERINKLVHDLLFLTKMDRAPRFQFDDGKLDIVIQHMEAQLRLLAGDRVLVFSLENVPTHSFDKDKMKQVILNLFQNAVQHTDSAHGIIEISLNMISTGLELQVRDNGSGIPEAHLSHLFERFYRIDSSRARKYGGAGLGLAITKSIVEFHGGSIHVKSKPGEGTTFIVQLPMQP